MTAPYAERVDWLREAATSGDIHTIRLAWTDRLGAWRGKRLPVERYLASPDARMGFCDGMIVVDVKCDVIEETPFSNFDTGYPDMYLRPRPDTIGQVGWVPGEAFVLGELQSHDGDPLGVAPANVLGSVLARLAEAGATATAALTLSGRLMSSPTDAVDLLPDGTPQDASRAPVLGPAAEGLLVSGVPVRAVAAERDGGFRVSLGRLPVAEAAMASAMTKAALREVAILGGQQATFMTRLPGLDRSSQLRIALALDGLAAPDDGTVGAAVASVRALLQPSINAFKAGPPTISVAPGELAVVASSEADPFTAAAALLAVVGAAQVGAESRSGDAATLAAAADALASATWARDWLGDAFLDNAIPLLRHESDLFNAVVTEWELDRYWSSS